jgi:hypothetical protein
MVGVSFGRCLWFCDDTPSLRRRNHRCTDFAYLASVSMLSFAIFPVALRAGMRVMELVAPVHGPPARTHDFESV